MFIDPRGGHNRYKINDKFFTKWSKNMAYLLGFIYADGAIMKCSKSSRTCYLSIAISDHEHLENIRKALGSNHKISLRKGHLKLFPEGKYYKPKDIHILRVGSKKIYRDLLKYGLKPKKSLIIKYPTIPKLYISHFIRGYFDGDGCVNLYNRPHTRIPRITTIFTSGSKLFLNRLSKILYNEAGTSKNLCVFQHRAYRLRYSKNDSLKLLKYIYRGLNSTLFLDRKYNLYQKYLTYNI